MLRSGAMDPAERTESNGVTKAIESRATGRVLKARAQHRLAASTHPHDALEGLLGTLRIATARDAVRALGLDVGFRLEDAVVVRAEIPRSIGVDFARRWLRRRIPAAAHLGIEERTDADAVLEMEIAERHGWSPRATRYAVGDDGRVAVEAFELHVVEHCNLRCAHCCNMSPFLDAHVLPVEEIAQQCRTMASALAVDVFKIMGGEPLLHPRIAEVIVAIRESRISDVVRLFTNGLLLHRMSDEFWSALDQMTISNYSSAPTPRRNLELAREKAKKHDFVLNVKDVVEFSEVLSPKLRSDAAETRRTFENCWLRHRCLVVRNGVFYTCTRAAYAGEFVKRIRVDAPPSDFFERLEGDGVSLAGPDLKGRMLAYLNREEPLESCRYCFGGDGPISSHEQLAAVDIASGRTRSSRSRHRVEPT